MRPLRPAALLLTAAVVAGCGGAGSSSPESPSAGAAAPQTSAAPLSVGGTSIHLGDATTGSGAGTQVLPNTKVPQSETRRDGVGAGASCANTDVVPSDETMGTVVEATLCLLNGERADAGLGPLAPDAELASAAKVHSQDMIRGQYFDHVAPDGSTPVDRIRRTGYIPAQGRWIVGENLAWGTGVLATPQKIVTAWMNSAGHRANILRDTYTQIGFGVYTGNPQKSDGEGATYTTTFGSKQSVAVGAPAPAAARRPARTLKVKSKRRKARAFKARKGAKAAKAAKARQARAASRKRS